MGRLAAERQDPGAERERRCRCRALLLGLLLLFGGVLVGYC